MTEWIDILDKAPNESGYYYTHYLNRNGEKYYKALWWCQKERHFFLYRWRWFDYDGIGIGNKDNDCLKVYKWKKPRHKYYVPCMMEAEAYG